MGHPVSHGIGCFLMMVALVMDAISNAVPRYCQFDLTEVYTLNMTYEINFGLWSICVDRSDVTGDCAHDEILDEDVYWLQWVRGLMLIGSTMLLLAGIVSGVQICRGCCWGKHSRLASWFIFGLGLVGAGIMTAANIYYSLVYDSSTEDIYSFLFQSSNNNNQLHEMEAIEDAHSLTWAFALNCTACAIAALGAILHVVGSPPPTKVGDEMGQRSHAIHAPFWNYRKQKNSYWGSSESSSSTGDGYDNNMSKYTNMQQPSRAMWPVYFVGRHRSPYSWYHNQDHASNDQGQDDNGNQDHGGHGYEDPAVYFTGGQDGSPKKMSARERSSKANYSTDTHI